MRTTKDIPKTLPNPIDLKWVSEFYSLIKLCWKGFLLKEIISPQCHPPRPVLERLVGCWRGGEVAGGSEWFQVQMMKNILFFNDFKCKCWKTFMFFHVFKLKYWKTWCFWLTARGKCERNIIWFHDLKIRCWKRKMFSMIWSSSIEKHLCFSFFIRILKVCESV